MAWTGYPSYYGYVPVAWPTRMHPMCRNFIPLDSCAKKNIRVPPMEEACDDFEARYPWTPGPIGFQAFVYPTPGKEREMLKSYAESLERELGRVRRRIEDQRSV